MRNITITPLTAPIDIGISLPGSLSYTIRALTIASLIKGNVNIANVSKCEDSYSMLNLLKKLGLEVTEGVDNFGVKGDISDIKEGFYKVNIHLSGRTGRTALALLCLVPGIKVITCDKQFQKRPVGELVRGLRQLGANISFMEKEGHLPVKIFSDRLNSGKVIIDGSISSQFISSLLLIAPILGKLELKVNAKSVSKSYIDMTLKTMEYFGVKVSNHNYKMFEINGNQNYIRRDIKVEADATSAGYFFAIAAISGSRIKVRDLHPDSKQGDVRLAELFGKMGCKIDTHSNPDWIEVEGTGMLKGIDTDMSDIPDSIPTLAVVAAVALGKTKIRGISTLRIKETDRVKALLRELAKVGISVSVHDDTLEITGGKLEKAKINTYKDHRMAMSFAVLGANASGITITNPDVVNKSYPGFWDQLEKIGLGVTEENLP